MSLLCSMALLAGCSGSKHGGESGSDDELINTSLIDAISASDINRASVIADSMALDVDELSNNESVAVLMAYLQIHNAASKANEKRRDLETLRKFVDVYELSMQRDRSGMTEAIDEARRINPEVDLAALYSQFRARLAEYDAVDGEELTVETPEPSDSTAAKGDSVPAASSGEDLPVELRPAD